MMNLRSCFTLLFSLLCLISFGQRDDLNELNSGSNEWSEGKILLGDGTELKGLIKFDNNSGILAYQNGSESRSFIARQVKGFTIVDNATGVKNVYYVFDYIDSKTSMLKPFFFKVIREFKTFAVLCKVDPVNVERKLVSSPGAWDPKSQTFSRNQDIGNTVEVSQAETIYVMDEAGRIQPYAKTVDSKIDGILFDREDRKYKMLNKGLLKQHIGAEQYKKLEAYAKKDKLEFGIKNDLIRILNHYATLVTE